MADISERELDEVWEQFHAVVNMTSRELHEWLMTESAGEATEKLPEQMGPETGRHVLEVLGKRRGDLTDDDIGVMRGVVDTVSAERGTDPDPTAGDSGWRHRMMNLGHDPLKPLASERSRARRR
ncbi:DUF3140 domain-containing protein [Streptomyces sp. PRKS01-29]|nr:DUF3140 domain-containing protein [Streptomyces sabulosicollis]MBI0297326.1 DUF3140 domain-containing protein [Streptomyces sabulosicollis]